jgi:hypothetical protein
VYRALWATAAPTVRASAAPATSGCPSFAITVQTCGIEASSVRGRIRTPPTTTPSSGTTSFTSSQSSTSRANADAVVTTVRVRPPMRASP